MKLPSFSLPFVKKRVGGGAQRVSNAYPVRPLLPTVIVGDIIGEYDVGLAHVVLSDFNGKGMYTVREPALNEAEQNIYSLLMEALYYSLNPIEAGDPVQYIEQTIWRVAEEMSMVDEVTKSHDALLYYIRRDSVGYGVADVLMVDDDVEEISCTSFELPVNIVHRKQSGYDWMVTNVKYNSEDELQKYVQRLVQKAGKAITTAVPFMDAMTKEGHRLAATLGNEISLPGSSWDVRKFPKEPLSIGNLILSRTISPLMAAYYWLLVEAKGFVMVVGPMATGKSTAAGSLISLIPPDDKVVTIEDTPELMVPHAQWERLKTRTSYSATENKFDIDLFGLTKLSMRLRPDYVIVGEARGEEISTLFQAAAIGHGAISTIHGDSPEAAIVRMSAQPLNVGKASQMLVWSYLMMNRIRLDTGLVVRRAITSKEVLQDGTLREIFSWDARTDEISPVDAGEIVKRSYRLHSVANLKGWSQDRVGEELNERATCLQDAVMKGKYHYREIAEVITEFYRKKYGVKRA
jgi:flagellar protein FlaI